MNWGSIIAGAMGGAAGAAKEIGDTNLKLREQEEAAARERQWRREDALFEMDEKIRRLPTLARAEGEAEAIKEGVLRDAKNKAREDITKGIIGERLSGSVIGDESTWTPEQEAVLKRGMAEREAELRQDPKVRQEVGLQMGELTEKDIMADDRNRDIAALRAEVANAKTESQLAIAQARLDNALAVANIRASGGAVGPKESDINSALNAWSTAEQRARSSFRKPTTMEEMDPAAMQRYQDALNKHVSNDAAVKAARQRYESLSTGQSTVGGNKNRGDNSQGGLPKPTTRAELSALPKGTRYQAPDGTIRIKQ